MREVVITGVGLLSAVGVGKEAHREGKGFPSPVQGNLEGMPVVEAFQIEKVRPQPFMKRRKDLKLMSRDARIAVQAAGLALQDADMDPANPDTWPVAPEEVGLFMGVGLEPGDILELSLVVDDARGEDGCSIDLDRLGAHSIDLIPPLSSLKTLPNMALAHVSINFGLMGPGEALSPWGTSGFAAALAAVEAIERGECEIALVGAADSDVDLGGITTHARMGHLATKDGSPGQIPGEGGAFLVLERRASALKRGATILGTVQDGALWHAGGTGVEDFSTDGLRVVLEKALSPNTQSPKVVVGTAGHHTTWRTLEEKALETALDGSSWTLNRPSDDVGSCVAASGLLDLAVALVRQQEPAEILALVRGMGGDWASLSVRAEVGEA